jgi:hypothetical protein
MEGAMAMISSMDVRGKENCTVKRVIEFPSGRRSANTREGIKTKNADFSSSLNNGGEV